MITEAICALISVFTLAYSMAAHPVTFRCPGKTFLAEGVQRDGSFGCYFPVQGTADNGYALPGKIEGRIYCTGGGVPIQVNQRTVGCMRRHP